MQRRKDSTLPFSTVSWACLKEGVEEVKKEVMLQMVEVVVEDLIWEQLSK